jgi:chitin-binding protein
MSMSKRTSSLIHLIAVVCMTGAFEIWGHGLMVTPPSRMWFCGAETKPDQIANGTAKYPECKDAFAVNNDAAYNYMAVVTHDLGRAVVDPLPAHVCGAAGEFWKGAKTPWDAAMQWPTTPASAGPLTITWDITLGPHFGDTQDFRYWITKANFVFSPTKELTWDDFETEAFCVLKYDDEKPAQNPAVTTDKAKSLFSTTCQLPSRQGHHVIYGEWGRTPPTFERFHGCIDLSFGGTGIKRDGLNQRPAGLKTPVKKVDGLGRAGHPGAGRLFPVLP